MIDLEERSRGVVVGPRGRFVIEEVINGAGVSGSRQVGGNNLRGSNDTAGRDRVCALPLAMDREMGRMGFESIPILWKNLPDRAHFPFSCTNPFGAQTC